MRHETRIIADYGTGFIQEEKDEDSAPLMILEYMQYGDLASFLKSHRYMCIKEFATNNSNIMITSLDCDLVVQQMESRC